MTRTDLTAKSDTHFLGSKARRGGREGQTETERRRDRVREGQAERERERRQRQTQREIETETETDTHTHTHTDDDDDGKEEGLIQIGTGRVLISSTISAYPSKSPFFTRTTLVGRFVWLAAPRS